MKKVYFMQRFLAISMLLLGMCLTAKTQTTVQIDGIWYQLNDGWWSYYYDANGNYQSGDYYEHAAFVTYDPSISPYNGGTGSDGYEGDMKIPDKVSNGNIDYPVVGVSSYAFAYCRSLTSIELPAGVKQIVSYAFNECSGLTSVTMPGVEFVNDYAFDGCSSLTSVSMPVVKQLGSHVFSGCTALTSVSMPAIESITGSEVFYNCSFALNLPKTLTNISSDAFRGNNFTSITMESGNANYTSVDGVLYDKNITKIVAFPAKKGGTYTIPGTVTKIPSYTFPCNTTLDELVIPATVTSFADYAFECLPHIKKLTIEDGTNDLTFGQSNSATGYNDASNNYHYISYIFNETEEVYIGRNVKYTKDGISLFATNNYLNKVGIGTKVTSIPSKTFMQCFLITDVNYNGTITDWCKISFGDADATPMGKIMAADRNGSAILYLQGSPLHSQVNIPEGATTIGAYAFYGMDGVSSVIVPSTVTSIDQYAFSNSTISEIWINSDAVISLADANAFSSDATIVVKDYAVMAKYKADPVWATLADNIHTKEYLSTTVTLTAMTNSPALLPALNALEKVNDEYRISSLTNLKIKGTMNGWDILMIRTKMPKLKTLDLSEATILDNDGGHEYYTGYHTTANTISAFSFYQLSNLRKVMLPQNITSIDEYAFAECTNLSEVLYMPETCTEIKSSAFSNSGLQSIVINKGVKRIGYDAFNRCSRLQEVTFTKGLEEIGGRAFQECYSLKKLVFPTTLKRIEENAFYNCSQLEKIDFAEGLKTIGYYAFAYCSRLKDLHLPTSLETIDSEAFRYCTSMSNVHVPSMLHSIGNNAFKDCGLKSVYSYTLYPVQINQNTFDYTDVNLYVPETSFYTYYLNTQWSQFPNLIEISGDQYTYSQWYTPRDIDIEINLERPISGDTDGGGNMEPGSGMIFVGDGEQLVKKLIMNWGHGDHYPSLIENGNLSVDELAFIMNVYPGRWYFFSFPFDVKLKNIKHDGKWVWRYYDSVNRGNNGPTGSWKNVEDGVLKANVGYIFQCNAGGDLEIPVENPEFFTKAAARTRGAAYSADKSVSLLTHESNNPEDASWNFIGNPNLSYYDLNDMASAKDFSAPVTVWDPEQQTYTAVVPGDDDYDFHPFQAFFVQKPADSEEMTFRGENRATYAQTAKKANARSRTRSTRSVDENRLFVNLEISNGTTTDKTRVVFDDSKTALYDTGVDANKFLSFEKVPQIYTLDGQNVKYSVNNRPNGSHEVSLGFVAPSAGEYTIGASLTDCKMALKDLETGVTHDLGKGAYTFETSAGTFDKRFMLVSGVSTDISEIGIDGIDINADANGISISGNSQPVNIYTLNGVRKATLANAGSVSLPKGTYIVTAGDKSTKVLVK